MVKQITATPSTKKISDLYTRITAENPTLILQPAFQRRFVWNSAHMEKFIDTILKGLPIPEIYLAQSGIDLEKIEAQEVVVDGQQRLTTIVKYIQEKSDSKIFGKIVKKFSDLTKEEQKDFLNYNIVIRDLGDLDSEKLKDIFRRINSTNYSLNDIELHNAIYDGQYLSVAKEIVSELDKKHMPFLTDSQISRMEDIHFILLIMSTKLDGGYFSSDSEIEKHIIENNDEFEESELIKAKILDVFNYINSLNLAPDSIWFRKSNMFTLAVELLMSVECSQNINIKNELLELEKNILKNKGFSKDDNDYAKYYSYMYTGTNSRQARVIRGNIFRKYIFGKK